MKQFFSGSTKKSHDSAWFSSDGASLQNPGPSHGSPEQLPTPTFFTTEISDWGCDW